MMLNNDLMERKANITVPDGERITRMCNGTENTHGNVSRKRTFSRSTCAPSLHSLYEASDGELRAYLEENAFLVLAQKSVIKKPRVEVLGAREAPFDLNFAALPFPRKLWHIAENETYRSIGWDPRGIYVVIDEELFVNEILSKQGESKIFVTTNMKNFVRQLNLYGFKKVCLSRHRSLCTKSTVARESASKKQVFHNSSFCRGYTELLYRMKRRVRVRSELASAPGDSPSTCASQSPLLPQQGSEASTSLNMSDAPLDLSLKNKLSGTSSSSSEACPNSTLLRALALLTRCLLASGRTPTNTRPSSALAQPCPNCGHNLLPFESSQTDSQV